MASSLNQRRQSRDIEDFHEKQGAYSSRRTKTPSTICEFAGQDSSIIRRTQIDHLEGLVLSSISSSLSQDPELL